MRVTFDSVNVGDAIPVVEKQPITRTTLALFCGASNDHNPIHVDIDFARAAGLPDVFAHGMLTMAYLGQALSNWVPQAAVRSFGVRFTSITQLGDSLSCKATVVDKFQQHGEGRVRLEIQAVNQNGEVRLAGVAVVALM